MAAGTTENVVVMLDEPIDPDTPLWAMLHVDEGVQGVYEFPGADVPVEYGRGNGDGAVHGAGEAAEEATARGQLKRRPKRQLRKPRLRRLRKRPKSHC